MTETVKRLPRLICIGAEPLYRKAKANESGLPGIAAPVWAWVKNKDGSRRKVPLFNLICTHVPRGKAYPKKALSKAERRIRDTGYRNAALAVQTGLVAA